MTFDRATRLLTVSRAVVEVNPKFHPNGGRFLVKEYPRDKEFRRFKLSAQIVAKLGAHIDSHRLGHDDLIFAMRSEGLGSTTHPATVEASEFEFTEPNAAGRRYRHGTLSAYSAGRCRCQPAAPPVAPVHPTAGGTRAPPFLVSQMS